MAKELSIKEWLTVAEGIQERVDPEVGGPIIRLARELRYLHGLLAIEGSQGEWRDAAAEAGRVGEALARGAFGRAAEMVGETEASLSGLGERAKSLTVSYVGHAHMDMNWLWDWPETVDLVIHTLTTVDRLMDEFPDFLFSQSQTTIYDTVRRFDPALFERIGRRVAEGRWEITANQWVEGDKNLASDESIVRHILYSKAFFQEHWGIPLDAVQVDFEPDTFGHPRGMPTLLSQAGIRWLYFCRGGPGHPAFRWRAPDGSEVVAWSDFEEWYNGTVTGDEVEAALRFYRDTGVRRFLKVYGVGDHGGGPTRRDLRTLEAMRAWPLFPRLEYAHLADHFRALEAERERLPVVTGELNFVFPGCYSSESDTKTMNAENEAGMRDAEGLQAMAGLLGVTLPKTGIDARAAWHDLLFTHFHDILSGSGIPETYRYALGRGQDVTAAARRLAEQAMGAIAGAVDLEGAGDGVVPLVVFNPVAWDREDAVTVDVYERFPDGATLTLTDAEGNPVPVQYRYDAHLGFPGHHRARITFVARVGGLGYAAYFVGAGEPRAVAGADVAVATRAEGHQVLTLSGQAVGELGLVSRPETWRPEELPRALRLFRQLGVSTYQQGLRVETAAFQAEVTPGESGISVRHPDGRTVTIGTLERFVEEPHGMSAWEVGADQGREAVRGTRWTLEELGPVRAVLRGESSLRGSQVVARAHFYAALARIDWELEIDWREFGTRTDGIPGLTISFGADAEAMTAHFGQSAGSIARSLPSRDVPAQGWTRLGRTVVLHPTRYGVSATRGRIGVTLLRASCDPDPYAEVGRHRVTVSYLAGEGMESDGLTREAIGRLSGLTGWVGERAPGRLSPRGSTVALDAPIGVATAVKPAEDGRGVIVRVRQDGDEARDLPLRLADPAARVEGVTMLEASRPGETVRDARGARVRVPGHGFASFRIIPPQG